MYGKSIISTINSNSLILNAATGKSDNATNINNPIVYILRNNIIVG